MRHVNDSGGGCAAGLRECSAGEIAVGNVAREERTAAEVVEAGGTARVTHYKAAYGIVRAACLSKRRGAGVADVFAATGDRQAAAGNQLHASAEGAAQGERAASCRHTGGDRGRPAIDDPRGVGGAGHGGRIPIGGRGPGARRDVPRVVCSTG